MVAFWRLPSQPVILPLHLKKLSLEIISILESNGRLPSCEVEVRSPKGYTFGYQKSEVRMNKGLQAFE